MVVGIQWKRYYILRARLGPASHDATVCQAPRAIPTPPCASEGSDGC
jgi:hypothetical protein